MKFEKKIKISLWCMISGMILIGSIFLSGASLADAEARRPVQSAVATDFTLEPHSHKTCNRDMALQRCYEAALRCAMRSGSRITLRPNLLFAGGTKLPGADDFILAATLLRVIDSQFNETGYINICKQRQRVLPVRAGPVCI